MCKKKQVTGLTVAPLIGLSVEILSKVEYELASGIILSPKPRIEIDVEWQGDLGDKAMETIREAEWGLEHSYEADPAVHAGPLEVKSEEALKGILLSMWITRPTGASIRYLLQYREPWQNNYATSISLPQAWFIPHKVYKYHKLIDEDIPIIRKVNESVQMVFQKELSVRRTLHLLYGALQMWYWQARFVMFTTVLESLFTTDFQEISHKISERVAWFLEGDTQNRKEAFDRMRQVYKIRSRIVHGSELWKLPGDESANLLSDLEYFCQRSLQKVLLVPDVFAHFTAKTAKREKYLTSLLFT